MSKGNRSLAAKVKKNYSVYKDRDLKGDAFHTKYDQGYDAYFDGYTMNPSWHPHKKQGWKAARDSDMQLLQQFRKPVNIDKVMSRLCKALGINKSELMLHSVTSREAA